MAETVEILILGYDNVFLAEARACAARAHEGAGASDSTLQAGAAASAVVAACAAVESFVSECGAFHSHHGRLSEQAQAVIHSRDKPLKRLNRLVREFNGEGISGHTAYGRLKALFALRNCVVHRSAAYLRTEDWPAKIKEEHRRLIPFRKHEGLDWTSRVFHEDVADWAVETVEQILSDASLKVPRPPPGPIRNYKLDADPGELIVSGGADATLTGPRHAK